MENRKLEQYLLIQFNGSHDTILYLPVSSHPSVLIIDLIRHSNNQLHIDQLSAFVLDIKLICGGKAVMDGGEKSTYHVLANNVSNWPNHLQWNEDSQLQLAVDAYMQRACSSDAALPVALLFYTAGIVIISGEIPGRSVASTIAKKDLVQLRSIARRLHTLQFLYHFKYDECVLLHSMDKRSLILKPVHSDSVVAESHLHMKLKGHYENQAPKVIEEICALHSDDDTTVFHKDGRTVYCKLQGKVQYSSNTRKSHTLMTFNSTVADPSQAVNAIFVDTIGTKTYRLRTSLKGAESKSAAYVADREFGGNELQAHILKSIVKIHTTGLWSFNRPLSDRIYKLRRQRLHEIFDSIAIDRENPAHKNLPLSPSKFLTKLKKSPQKLFHHSPSSLINNSANVKRAHTVHHLNPSQPGSVRTVSRTAPNQRKTSDRRISLQAAYLEEYKDPVSEKNVRSKLFQDKPPSAVYENAALDASFRNIDEKTLRTRHGTEMIRRKPAPPKKNLEAIRKQVISPLPTKAFNTSKPLPLLEIHTNTSPLQPQIGCFIAQENLRTDSCNCDMLMHRVYELEASVQDKDDRIAKLELVSKDLTDENEMLYDQFNEQLDAFKLTNDGNSSVLFSQLQRALSNSAALQQEVGRLQRSIGYTRTVSANKG